MPPINFLLQGNAGTELIYSFIIIICNLMIYHATKEMYQLSSYKGIKYFRQAFLFFAIAYFFRYSIKFLLVFFDVKGILEISPMFIGIISLFFYLYFTSMAIFFLLYSIIWKNDSTNSKRLFYIFNIVALVIALIGIFFTGPEMPFILNIILLIIAFIVLLTNQKDYKKKKERNLFIIYTLLFIFGSLNIIDILIPDFFQFFQMLLYLASISIFMIILYKVLKRVGD